MKMEVWSTYLNLNLVVVRRLHLDGHADWEKMHFSWSYGSRRVAGDEEAVGKRQRVDQNNVFPPHESWDEIKVLDTFFSFIW
jgi:hypothetical protein